MSNNNFNLTDGKEFRMVQAGEKTAALCGQFQHGFDKCIEQNSHRQEPYWILVHASWFRNGEELRMTFSPRAKRTPKMLNTMCFRIDNQKGTVTTCWVLPPDAPSPIITPETAVCEDIAESAKGIAVLY